MTDASPADLLADLERRARRYETPCGDGTMVWRAWGRGRPLLLAHGAHGSWSHWIRNIEALAAHWTVWAPDLPGYGESALPEREDPAAIADALARGLRELVEPDLPVDAVGFSFGGVMSAWLAARHPDLVRRLIVIGSGGLGTPVGDIQLTRVRGLQGESRREALRTNLLGLMLHDPESVDALALQLQDANIANGRLDPKGLVQPDRLSDALSRVSAQLDAIWGACDRAHPVEGGQEAVLRRFEPDLDFRVVPEAGHWAMYERADTFNRTLIALLEQPLRSPGQASPREELLQSG